MAESKRYYWIKLKTNFFDLEEIDFLLSQENGCKYIVLYQMLCLNTANNNGEMITKIGEILVPYNVKKIVRDTKYFDFDTVTVALELFKKLGLIYEEENKILRITNFDQMVGSESGNSNAQRQKRFRERQKQKKLLEPNVTISNGCNVIENNEEYRDKSIEYRDKNIDKEIDIDRFDIDKEKIKKMVSKNLNEKGYFLTDEKLDKVLSKISDYNVNDPVNYITTILVNEIKERKDKNGYED